MRWLVLLNFKIFGLGSDHNNPELLPHVWINAARPLASYYIMGNNIQGAGSPMSGRRGVAGTFREVCASVLHTWLPNLQQLG